MEVYYNVTYVEKRKKCKFNFSYVRNKKVNIIGSVVVDYSIPKNSIIFDPESDKLLDSEEKAHILSCVLRYINITAV